MREQRKQAEGGHAAIDLDAKRAQETRTLLLMVGIYCKGNGHAGRTDCALATGTAAVELCPQCRELADYCLARIDACPHMEQKTFCSACETHCYRPDMRARIREAMAYAGPRMLFHDPIGAIRHLRYGRPRKKR